MARATNILDTRWSKELAYVVGLFASDGNLSPDGRHLNMTSKDLEIPRYVKEILKLSNTIGRKGRGGSVEKKYFVIQFGSKNFYAFLLSIGLVPRKSKILGKMVIPDFVFTDFLRGCIDGDGSIQESAHPESRQMQLRLALTSASEPFLAWVLTTTRRLVGVTGGWISGKSKKSVQILRFGKSDSIQILKAMYAPPCGYKLERKYRVAKKYLGE